MILQIPHKEMNRPGLSLVEVLATIFILAIGMVSVLVLFPVGALKVRQSLINERIALCAANGESSFKVLNQTGYITDAILASGPMPFYAQTPDGNYLAMIDQCADSAATGTYPASSTNSLSVFFATSIPPTQNQTQFKKIWFFLQDDIEWDNTGSTNGAFARGQAFSWAYLLRKNIKGPTPMFDLTILVYHGRSPSLYESENDKKLSLALMADSGAVGNLAVAVTALPTKEEGRTLVKGSWIVDTTNREFEFYQVQAITEGKDNNGATCFRLELDRPIISKYGSNPTEMFWADYLSGVFPKGEIAFD